MYALREIWLYNGVLFSDLQYNPVAIYILSLSSLLFSCLTHTNLIYILARHATHNTLPNNS
jgi:predicted metallopeptidase